MKNNHGVFLEKQKNISLDVKIGSFLAIASVAMLALTKQHPSMLGIAEGFSMGVGALSVYKNFVSLKPKFEEYKEVSKEEYQSIKKDLKLSGFAALGASISLQVAFSTDMLSEKGLANTSVVIASMILLQIRNSFSVNDLQVKKDLVKVDKKNVLKNISSFRENNTLEPKAINSHIKKF